jgi:hypothetical protein
VDKIATIRADKVAATATSLYPKNDSDDSKIVEKKTRPMWSGFFILKQRNSTEMMQGNKVCKLFYTA